MTRERKVWAYVVNIETRRGDPDLMWVGRDRGQAVRVAREYETTWRRVKVECGYPKRKRGFTWVYNRVCDLGWW